MFIGFLGNCSAVYLFVVLATDAGDELVLMTDVFGGDSCFPVILIDDKDTTFYYRKICIRNLAFFIHW